MAINLLLNILQKQKGLLTLRPQQHINVKHTQP